MEKAQLGGRRRGWGFKIVSAERRGSEWEGSIVWRVRGEALWEFWYGGIGRLGSYRAVSALYAPLAFNLLGLGNKVFQKRDSCLHDVIDFCLTQAVLSEPGFILFVAYEAYTVNGFHLEDSGLV